MKIAFKTFGCRLNISETESIISKIDNNENITNNIDDSDIVVINSCTVTSEAEKKCLRLINQVLNNNKICIVTGCFDPTTKIQDDNLFYISIDYKGTLAEILNGFIAKNSRKKNIYLNDLNSIINLHSKNRFFTTAIGKNFHSRAFLKIQDGCNNNCTYCKVRIVRGKEQSLSFNNIIKLMDEIKKSDFNEVVLTGINIAAYKYGNLSFSSLIENLIQKYPNIIFQLSSIEIKNLDDKFFEIIKNKNIKPYFHLPIQSASDSILSLMRRPYNVAEFIKITEKIKKSREDCFLSTDIIVGFPQENKNTIRETEKVIREIGFHHLHLFPFSKREGTEAFTMAETLTNEEKSYYIERLFSITRKNKHNFINSFIGLDELFLVEKIEKGILKGRTYHNLNIAAKNRNFIKVFKGEYIKVKIIGKIDDTLVGEFF